MGSAIKRLAGFGRFWSAVVLLELVLLLPLVGVLSQRSDGFSCPSELQWRALTNLYSYSNGTGWNEQTLWRTNGTCVRSLQPRLANSSSGAGGGNVTLPPHCCWHGVDCCLLEIYNASVAQCSQYQCDCTPGTVTGLSLGHNGLAGELPRILNDSIISDLACSLRMLFLGGNALTGYVPPGVGKLSDLRILSLGSNNLTGPIPEALTDLAFLEELDLANNALTGSVPPLLCGGLRRESKLRDLILSNNLLTGTLDLPACESLIYLDVQNNNLVGPMLDISAYRQLHILRLGNNYFNGTVNVDSFDLRLLVVLDLSRNFFGGPLPNFVGNSSQMTNIRLNENNFSGTISPDLFTVGTMATFVAYNNSLTGTLPENVGFARGISTLNLRSNELHGKLPESLRELAPNVATVDVSLTHMSCCGYDYVQGQGYRYFNMNDAKLPSFLLASQLNRPVVDTELELRNMRCPFIQVDPRLTDGQFVTWAVDPEYYLYEGCTCQGGYAEVWTSPRAGVPSMGPLLQCVLMKDPWYILYPWAVVLIVLGGLLAASWLTYLMCFRRGKNAALVQGCFNIRKRIQGEPVGGQVSIVVTDIEGYSDLMKQSPELMTRALNLHNAIVRNARWNNFGYTLEQEGDSFALVFYEAHDAVVFCLQTQLALNRQAWPEGLFNLDARDAAKRRQPAPSLLNAISVMTNNLTHSLFGGKAAMPDDRSVTLLRTANASMDGNPDVRQSSAAADILPPGRPSAAAGSELSGLRYGSALPTATASASGIGIGAGAGPSSKGPPVLFNGLRVRMGVATGALPPGSSSKGSAVMDVAKVVSDAANGGQIMIDEATFRAIKERIEELRAVDHNGMNFKKLNSIKPPWYSCLKRKHLRNPDEALLLDMGEYTHCPGSKRLPLFQLEATSMADTPGVGPLPPPPSTPRGSGHRGRAHEPMRLYQLVAPALVARAKVFGNKVTVKEEWYCSDAPYFDAPGTLEAPLGSVDGPLELPAITMAFAIVEGGKGFAARNRRDVRRVNDVCAACVRACLRLVPGGYLCRIQDGDLKYMVAFATPEAAVEWSLLLQDVLMYADWPEAALKYWREEYDDRGRLVFRGPRVKIGLCEGCPRSIIPDHIGRADYHGASVNQAARYMDAAAHGGMIAIEASLASKVMNTWRAAAAAAELAEAAAAAAAATAGTSTAATCAAGAAAPVTAAGKSRPSAFAVAGASAAAAAAAALSGSSVSTSAGSSGLAGRPGPHSAAAAPPPNTPSRTPSRKGRMAAVQEADGADESPPPPPPPPRPSATVGGGTVPAPPTAAVRGPLAAFSLGPAPRPAASEPPVARGGGGGPVAEAAEGDGEGAAAAGSTPAANGNGSSAMAAEITVAAVVAAEASHFGREGGRALGGVESGPSMTSLASSACIGPTMMGTSSSTTTAPPPLQPFGSSASEADAPAEAVPPPPSSSSPSSLAGKGGGGRVRHHRPTPLERVPSANPSSDGSASSYGNNMAVAAAAAVGALPDGGMDEPAADSPLASLASAPPPPGGSALPEGWRSGPAPPSGPALKPAASAALPPRPGPAGGPAPPSALRNPDPGPRSHVSFAAVGSLPTLTSVAGSPGPFQHGDAPSAPAAVSPSPSSNRSPRPPALTPLSIPSGREREASLRLERAAAEAAKRVLVDGPADASYAAHVLAFRLGVFRFKGSPEPIHMAHVTLEHLMGRRFPADPPKGKGAKVGDSSGLVDECRTRLPDLASFMRDRYALLYCPIAAQPGLGLGSQGQAHSLTTDGAQPSPTNRRLRSLLGGGSPGGATSPRADRGAGGSFLAKSRSMGARRSSGGGGGGVAASSSGQPTSDSGVHPGGGAAGGSDGGGGGGGPRRGARVLVSQLASVATSSMRWKPGKAPAGDGQRGGGAHALPGDGADGAMGGAHDGAAGNLNGAAAAGRASVELVFDAALPAGGEVQGGASVELESAPGPRAAADGGAGNGGSEPWVGRPSPLRFVSGRGEAQAERGRGRTAAPGAAAAVAPKEGAGGGAVGAPRGDERV